LNIVEKGCHKDNPSTLDHLQSQKADDIRAADVNLHPLAPPPKKLE
jgi:hypothetical protein